jgi:hypothetical protein
MAQLGGTDDANRQEQTEKSGQFSYSYSFSCRGAGTTELHYESRAFVFQPFN